MARVLGLDLGSYAVKAVVLETTMRSLTVRAFSSARRPVGADAAESLRNAVTEVLARTAPAADQAAISLPSPALATHVLSLPFVDPKRLEATIPFEIESQLPFDLTEAIFDYQVGSQKEKRSELVVGVVRKQEIRALLASLEPLGVDPRLITHPGLAYAYLLIAYPEAFGGPAEPGSTDGPLAVVDIGHERTTVAIGRAGAGVEFARTFAGGGKDLTRALAAEFQIQPVDAAAWKEEHGALGSQVVGPDAERAAGAFIRGLQPLLRELRQSFKAYSGRARQNISSLYLCGGTSQMPGLHEQLSRDFGVPARVLGMPMEAAAIPPQRQAEAMQAFALAVGGHASGAKALHFNLRRGDFAFKGHFDYVRERVGRLAAFAAAVIALLITSGAVGNSLESRREQAVDAVLCDVTRKVLGSCQKDYSKALNMLHGKESPASAIPKLTAVTLLTEFTRRMPTDVPATFDSLEISLDRMAARIETDSPKSIDKITTALKTYSCFKEVREGKIDKSRDGQNVDVRLDIEIDCPEDGKTRVAEAQ
jgi:general secretion pathway protein L